MRNKTMQIIVVISVMVLAPVAAWAQEPEPQRMADMQAKLQELMKAVCAADADQVKELLDEKPELAKAKEEKTGATPLHQLVRSAPGMQKPPEPAEGEEAPSPEEMQQQMLDRRMAIMDMLISKGADVNAQDETGATPLHALVEKPAMPALPVPPTAAVEAPESPTPPQVPAEAAEAPAMPEKPAPPSPEEVMKRQREMMEKLLKKGAKPDIPDKAGQTPEQKAADAGREDLAEMLKKMRMPAMPKPEGSQSK